MGTLSPTRGQHSVKFQISAKTLNKSLPIELTSVANSSFIERGVHEDDVFLS